MKRKWILLVPVLLISMFSMAQKNINVIGRYIITDASKNGEDITPIMLYEKAFLTFYHYEGNDDTVYFANIWEKSKSYSNGTIYGLTFDEPFTDNEGYIHEKISFFWKYSNSYDDVKGTASVIITIIRKPQGNHFIAKIVPEDLEILIYKGFVEGSLNLGVYQKN